MSAQGAINAITGSIASSIVSATKIASDLDSKMAAKARTAVKDKIKAIRANKELADKARAIKLEAINVGGNI